jgi:hypothetical protein
MKICENCGKEHKGTYGSGRFCSKTCARGFSTKAKRKEINEAVRKKLTKYNKIIETRICPTCNKSFETISTSNKTCCSSKCGSIYGGKLNKNKMHGNHSPQITLICKECKLPFEVNWNKRSQQFCSNDCRHINKEYLSNISSKMKITCNTIEARKRLRDIGRKGGFGQKGYTEKGTYYESNLEKQSFEYLEKNNIKFVPHKHIPNSSKVSDIYLIDKNLWIELDGINREKKKKWLGQDYQYWLNKLDIYKQNNLKYKIIYTLNELKDTYAKE